MPSDLPAALGSLSASTGPADLLADLAAAGSSSGCAHETLVLDDAVLRAWSYDGRDATIALLVSSDVRGFRTVRLRYSGARIIGRDGVELSAIPLEEGRTYVLSGEDRVHGPEGRQHRLRFFPAPEFGIAFDDLDVVH